MKTEQFTLSNGIKVIIANYPNSKMVSTNIFVGAGGRYETPETYGISHFLEHLVFKGTKKYPNPKDISKTIESVGGLLNAWTSEDHTAYWNMVPRDHSRLGFELLSEQVDRPMLKQGEIDMERGVVIEEIRRSIDDPFLFMIHGLNKLLWSGHPMECDVLGPEKNIKTLNREAFVSYMNQYYQSKNMVVSIAGNVSKKSIVDDLENTFGTIKNGNKKSPIPNDTAQKESKTELVTKDLAQSHAVLAYKTFGHTDSRKYALSILSTILGGGMSSRLFQEVREKRGLAYRIQAGIDTYSDAGFFFVYGGFNTKKAQEAIKTIVEVVDKSKSVLDDEELKKAKEYLKGTTYYKLDSTERASAWYGGQLMFNPDSMDPEKELEKLNKVTIDDVKNVAKELFVAQNENLLILGPFKDKEKFVKILNR